MIQQQGIFVRGLVLLVVCAGLGHALDYAINADLVKLHGPEGRHGVCEKVFHIRKNVSQQPQQYCHEYYLARSAILEDLSDFYNSLSERNKGQFSNPVSLLMADNFQNELSVKTVIMEMGNNPVLFQFSFEKFDPNHRPDHLMCVQLKPCPAKVKPFDASLHDDKVTTQISSSSTTSTTTTTSSSTTTTNRPFLGQDSGDDNAITIGVDSDNKRTLIDDLLAETDPRSWVFSAIVLGITSLLLLCLVFVQAVSICRLRSIHKKKKCYGKCRYGCRCVEKPNGTLTSGMPPETILCTNGQLTPRGSFRNVSTASGYQPLSRQWSECNPTLKNATPLYVSMTANEVYNAAQPGSISPGFGTLSNRSTWMKPIGLANGTGPQMLVTTGRVRRTSQDGVMNRSASDISSAMTNSQALLKKPAGIYTPYTQHEMSYYPTPIVSFGVSSSSDMLEAGNTSRYLESLDRRGRGLIVQQPANGPNARFLPSNINEEPSLEDCNPNNILLGLGQHTPKDYNSSMEPDLANIKPPAGYFDVNSSTEATYNGNLNSMIGSSGTFMNGHILNGDSGLGVGVGVGVVHGAWSGSSSPRPGEMPSLPPRGGRQSSSNDSNDSGKSSGMRPSPLPKSGSQSAKISDMYAAHLGPPIVNKPAYN